MRRLLVLLLLLAATVSSAAAGICEEWNALFDKIRDFAVDPAVARQEFSALHRQLKASYSRPGIGGSERVFPVVGYDRRSGVEGRGYRPKGFTFFDGNPKGIHPSLDLFVADRNQDSLDDRTGKAVEIVAYSGGVVVGVNREWEYPDMRRGGKYLWIYDPLSDHYVYYAHLSQIDVQLGQVVQAGDRLGLLGRTGKNAYRKRSSTHLHLMVLAYRNDDLVPFSPWWELVKARTLVASPPATPR